MDRYRGMEGTADGFSSGNERRPWETVISIESRGTWRFRGSGSRKDVMPTTTETTGSDLHEFIRFRRGAGRQLFGVVDAARDSELAFAARDRFGREIYSLFEVGPSSSSDQPDKRRDPAALDMERQFVENALSRMANVAPYLVPIEFRSRYPYRNSEYLDLWAERLGSSAGILLLSEVHPARLAIHLRGLFRATDDEGHKYYFRFYDPRVLRLYLPTCTPAEAVEFFGPVRRFLVEGKGSGRMISYRPDRSGVEVKETLWAPLPHRVRMGGSVDEDS